VSGDFNRDGIPDLATANSTGFSTSTVSVLLGNGNGSFRAPLSFAVGSSASFVVAADFNLDGNLDIGVANSGSNTISILLGIGNGVFLSALNFTVGSGPSWIGVSDLNGDGRPDLVVANGKSNTVSVLINRTAAQSSVQVSFVANAASFSTGPIAPGEILVISGSGLGPQQSAGFQLTSAGLVASQLAQTQVFFDGIAAPILAARDDQVSTIVPYALAGRATTQIVVVNNGTSSSAITMPVVASTPGLFTIGGTGTGQAAILNQDGSPNSSTNPAVTGSVVMIYGTGAGQTDPPGIDGMLATKLLPKPLLPIYVTIDGQAAQVIYAGAAPGLVAGVMQINVRVPQGIKSGAAPIQLQVGKETSQENVMLSVQ